MQVTGPTLSTVPLANYVPVYVMLPVSHKPVVDHETALMQMLVLTLPVSSFLLVTNS